MTDKIIRGRHGTDQHVESIVDHAESLGPHEWLDRVQEMCATTDDMAAKDMIQTMGLIVYFRVIDKLEALEELEGE